MAEFSVTGGSNGGNYAEYFTCKLSVWENSYSVANNTSNVGYKLELISGSSGTFYGYEGSYSVTINGTKVNSGSDTYEIRSHNTAITICSGTTTITHNSDGSKTIACSAVLDMDSGTYSPGDFYPSGNLKLTNIPRYMDYVSLSERGKTSSSISLNWSTSHARDWTQYSLNSGAWTDTQNVVASDNKSGYFTISGLSSNTKYSIKIRVRRTDSGLWSESESLSITTYAKTTPTISLSNKTVNTITVTSGCNVTVSSTQYRIKTSNGSYGSYQTSSTFTGLSPNTAYVIEVKKVGKDSGESGTKTLSVTTYQKALLSSVPNFNLGSDEKITLTNPSGNKIAIGLYNTDDTLAICSYKTITGTSYTFTFTDAELDTLYKLFGNVNTINVKIYLRTTNNSVNYYDNKKVTVTLTGNQKTGHLNIGGTYKRSKRWININGTWRRLIRWINVKGTWKRTI